MNPRNNLLLVFSALLLFAPLGKSQDSLKYYKVNKIEVLNLGLKDKYLTQFKFINDVMEFFHTTTKESTVKHMLLFAENDSVNRIDIGESERVIRSYPFLRNVKIELDTMRDDSVISRVHLSEKISRTYNISFSETKKSKIGLWIDEENLFGYAKSLTLGYDRQTGEGKKDNYSVIYIDKQLFNTRWYSSVEYKTLPFENIGIIKISKPFLSDNQNMGIAFHASQAKVNYPTFQQGKVVSLQNYDEWISNMYLSYKILSTPIIRMNAGSYNIWTNEDGGAKYFNYNSNYNFLFAGFQLLDRKYVEETKVNRLTDYEDIPVGTNITAAIAKQIHGGEEYADYRLMLNVQQSFYSSGFYFGIQHNIRTDFLNSITCNTINLTQLNSFYRFSREFLSSIRLINYTSVNQPKRYDRAVTLGETNGLPGFAESYFSGRDMMLVNWETRYPVKFSYWILRFASFTTLNAGTVYNKFEELGKTKFFRSAVVGFHIENEVMKGRQLTSIALVYNFDLPSKYSFYLTSKLSFDFFQAFEIAPFL